MVRTEYQAHLLDEYGNYLRKRVVGRETEEITMTRVDLAAALMRAFEKGVMKGILYESTDDLNRVVDNVSKQSVKPSSRIFGGNLGQKTVDTKPNQETTKNADKKVSYQEAVDALTDMLVSALSHH